MTAKSASTATKTEKPMAPAADPPEPSVSSATATPNAAESVPDTPAPNPAESVPDTPAEPGVALPATAAGKGRLAPPRFTERGVQTLLAMAFAGLLIFVFTDQSNRITRLDDRITRLEEKVDSRFAAQDEKIDAMFAAQNETIDEINLKLTALIAALNMSSAVDAAVEGRLVGAP